jgi:hypothetical protein
MTKTYRDLLREARASVREISPSQAETAASSGATILDVREESEWDQGHVSGARHISKSYIEQDIEALVPDHESPVVLYCAGGIRSLFLDGAQPSSDGSQPFEGAQSLWLGSQPPDGSDAPSSGESDEDPSSDELEEPSSDESWPDESGSAAPTCPDAAVAAAALSGASAVAVLAPTPIVPIVSKLALATINASFRTRPTAGPPSRRQRTLPCRRHARRMCWIRPIRGPPGPLP